MWRLQIYFRSGSCCNFSFFVYKSGFEWIFFIWSANKQKVFNVMFVLYVLKLYHKTRLILTILLFRFRLVNVKNDNRKWGLSFWQDFALQIFQLCSFWVWQFVFLIFRLDIKRTIQLYSLKRQFHSSRKFSNYFH